MIIIFVIMIILFVILAEKYVFAVLVEKMHFGENMFLLFWRKMRFYDFGGKYCFVNFFSNKMILGLCL